LVENTTKTVVNHVLAETAQPYQNDLRPSIYRGDDGNLPVLLVNIRLIDAYCIDPKHPLFLSVSQGLQSLKEIRAYEECLSVYPDLSTGRLVSPCVRKRLILWLLSRCDMTDATYNMTDIHFRRLEDYQPNAIDVGIERSTSIGKKKGGGSLLSP
jgi:hypothetical protein